MTPGIPWCCAGFRAQFEQGGTRGFSVAVKQDGRTHRFELEHRAIADGDVLNTTVDVPVALFSRVGIEHCPWCGVPLTVHYREHVDGMTLEEPDRS